MTTATYNETPTQQSNLPPAIQRQVTEANNLIKQLNAKPGEIPAGTVVQEMPGNDVPGANPTGGTRRWEPASPSATAQPSTAPAAQPAPPNPADTVAPDSAAWEQRYRTLQGKYDAETRATREILAAQQRTMDALISRDHSSVAPTPPPPEQTNEEFLRELGVTPKEIEDYGELLPIVAKMARNMIKPTASKLEAELNKTRQAAGTVAAAQIEQSKNLMFQTMDANPAIQGWRQINEDDNFLAWLDSVDIFSGTTRRVALTNAFQALDTARVTAIFEKFIQEDSARRSASGPLVNRDTLIAPGTPRGGSTEAPGGAANGKRILSEGEIKDFYSRVRRKQVTAEEYGRFSAEIAAATAEGRIKPDVRDHHANR